MHVRVAWEIYYHQQKQAAEKSATGASKMSGSGSDLLHPPGVGLSHSNPNASSMFSALQRPSLPPPPSHSLIPPTPGGPPSAHRFESPSMHSASSSHLTPSIPGLGGIRYPGGEQQPPPHGSTFHHPGVTPTAISGPPPGSMFSRESFSGLSYPTPSTAHDPWR